MTNARAKLTTRQAAARLCVNSEKIAYWCRTGALRAINVAKSAGGRPRYRIDVADLEAFEQKRLVRPDDAQPRRRRRSRSPPTDVIEFF
jgi:hypothetical protein